MAGLANPYFNKAPINEQNLIQGFINEAIQVAGFNVMYLPRKIQRLDLILGEDVLSKFDEFIEIEMYADAYEGWQGQGEILSKFGLEIRNQMVFKVSVTRWAEEIAKVPQLANSMIVSVRPQEGDLIYDPITKMLFEIKFIDQDWQFHQLGKKTYAYKMTCEMYQYSSDISDTGIAEVDDLINSMTNDITELTATSEVGTRSYNSLNILVPAGNMPFVSEDGETIFFDEMFSEPRVFDTTRQFNDEAEIIEFDVNNPFGDIL